VAGNNKGRIVRLTGERLRRRANARLDETNVRLDQAVDVLTRLVRVVAAQNERMNRNLDRLNTRFDRLTRAIVVGRTADLKRLAAVERRLDTLEKRVP